MPVPHVTSTEYSTADLAKLFGLSTQVIQRRLREAGIEPARKVGNAYMFSASQYPAIRHELSKGEAPGVGKWDVYVIPGLGLRSPVTWTNPQGFQVRPKVRDTGKHIDTLGDLIELLELEDALNQLQAKHEMHPDQKAQVAGRLAMAAVEALNNLQDTVEAAGE